MAKKVKWKPSGILTLTLVMIPCVTLGMYLVPGALGGALGGGIGGGLGFVLARAVGGVEELDS